MGRSPRSELHHPSPVRFAKLADFGRAGPTSDTLVPILADVERCRPSAAQLRPKFDAKVMFNQNPFNVCFKGRSDQCGSEFQLTCGGEPIIARDCLPSSTAQWHQRIGITKSVLGILIRSHFGSS